MGAVLVPAGVPALVAELVALDPVNVCAASVNVATVGVIEFGPPVPPTSPLAASVPSGIFALRAVTSAYPDGHDPLVIITVAPDGNPAAAAVVSVHVVPEHVQI